MDHVEMSELEEGEIIENENESLSSVGSAHEEFPVRDLLKNKKNDEIILSGQTKKMGNALRKFKNLSREKEKIIINGGDGKTKKSCGLSDLESISSDGECSSEEGEISFEEEKKFCKNKYYDKKFKGKVSYNCKTVEDIMCQIGETICRKARSKVKKLEKCKRNLDKYNCKSYDLWRHRTFSSHLKSETQKKVSRNSDSGESVEWQIRKKKRKRNSNINCREKYIKSSCGVDFDQKRKQLLEKLERKKAEEKLNELKKKCVAEVDKMEIEEVEMVIESTNYVDEPVSFGCEEEERKSNEEREEEECDIMELRLIALASNKRRKFEEKEDDIKKDSSELQERKDVYLKTGDPEQNLDRNELLLRAEALKTALLKKHADRLKKNKIRVMKGHESNIENDSYSEKEPGLKVTSDNKQVVDEDFCKENVQVEEEQEMKKSELESDDGGKESIEGKDSCLFSGSEARKNVLRPKRRKRKSGSFVENSKENSEIKEAVEEDDRTLRNQLLSDLMKKKSMKNVEKKSVLVDSVLDSMNKPVAAEPPSPLVPPPPKSKSVPASSHVPKAEIQRIIVHLGSEDSSEDEDAGHYSPALLPNSQLSKISERKKGIVKGKHLEKDYEKSVELLLSAARKKVELNFPDTPEAVYKHLPPSQRLEYMRLKRKIAERELLKQKNSKNSSSAQVSKEPKIKCKEEQLKNGTCNEGDQNYSKCLENNPETVKQSAECKAKTDGEGDSEKKVSAGLTKESMKFGVVESKMGIGAEKAGLLLPSSQALISKLKLLLKKIKVEKMIEENYEKEITRLKSQLSVFERKKNEQRFKIKKLGEESVKTYKAIQKVMSKAKGGKAQAKPNKLEEQKSKGTEVEGKEKADVVDDEEKNEQVEVGVESEGKREEPEKKSCKLKCEVEESERQVTSYESPLVGLKETGNATGRVDPNVMMCPYDLSGVCKDEDCRYQHCPAS